MSSFACRVFPSVKIGEDLDSIPKRSMKDLHLRHMERIRVFESCEVLPRERCSMLAHSSKYSLTFAARDQTLILFSIPKFNKLLEWDSLSIEKAHGGRVIFDLLEDGDSETESLSLTLGKSVHHLSLSSDELTLSVCGTSHGVGLSLDFYDVRTFFNENVQEKRSFTSLRPAGASHTRVQDLKWSPVDATRLALCLSDGRMMVLDVQSSVSVVAELPASEGITSVCWSPKGKQVSAGKQDATVVQFTPTLQPKKVIPCPRFYSQGNPVKVVDVLWLSTYSFAVAYAATADGNLETPPQLVVVTLPKEDENKSASYLVCNNMFHNQWVGREHQCYLCHIEHWDLMLAASADYQKVRVISKQTDKVNWEEWLLSGQRAAFLPMLNLKYTFALGIAIDYTNQMEILLETSSKCLDISSMTAPVSSTSSSVGTRHRHWQEGNTETEFSICGSGATLGLKRHTRPNTFQRDSQ